MLMIAVTKVCALMDNAQMAQSKKATLCGLIFTSRLLNKSKPKPTTRNAPAEEKKSERL